MKSRLWVLAVIPFLALLMGARTIPIVDPEPIAVPAGVTVPAVGRAVKMGFARYNWVITKEEPGRVEARLNIRSHSVTLEAQYDKSNVRLKYLASENLKYEEEDGQRMIHRNYRNWLNNVVGAIQQNLLAAQPLG